MLLAGCSGDKDGNDHTDPRTGDPITFIDWGAPGGEVVRDLDLEEFKFTAATTVVPSCLYAVSTRTVVESFCHAAGQASFRYRFVNRYIDIKSARLANGICAAAMVDVETASMVYVDVGEGAATVVTDINPAVAC